MANLLGRFRRIVLTVCLLVVAAYAVDYAQLRYRMWANKAPFATVTVNQVYAVPRNDHKLEYLPSDPQDQTCVNSLFPHQGDAPCWYLRGHTRQTIDL